MKELRTEIEIQATPDKVWAILTGLEKYPEWNPFIRQAIGAVKVGEKVDITVGNEPKKMVLHCVVTKAEPNKQMTWKYHVGVPFLFQGEHSFTIKPLGNNKILFIDREIFNGLLVFTQAKDIDTNSKAGFEAMDKALKTRSELAM